MKKKTVLFVVSLLSAASLSGCGGKKIASSIESIFSDSSNATTSDIISSASQSENSKTITSITSASSENTITTVSVSAATSLSSETTSNSSYATSSISSSSSSATSNSSVSSASSSSSVSSNSSASSSVSSSVSSSSSSVSSSSSEVTLVNKVVTDPTCTTQGYTTYIYSDGSTKTDDYVAAKNHSSYTTHERVEPTTTSEGNILYYECNYCHLLSDSTSFTNIISEDDTVLDKLSASLRASVTSGSGTYKATYYNTSTEPSGNIQEGNVLHCWDWSMANIKANVTKIAAAGYTAIQTSPMQPQKDYYNGNSNSDGWWKLYQPLGFSIATKNNQLGTKTDLISMVSAAHDAGLKVIVDVVANHLSGSTDTLDSAVKEYEPDIYGSDGTYSGGALLHSETTQDNSDSNAYLVTHGNIGMPDLDSSNQTVQNRVASLLKEYIDCGVDGFRFDAAKHIETPSESSGASDFWPDVLGQADAYATSLGKDTPYYYGEILNTPGSGRKYSWYTSYMSVIDNCTGNYCTQNVNSSSASGATAGSDYNSNQLGEKITPSKAVLWAESHDTYCDSASSGYSTSTINKSFAISGSRSSSMSLYFCRPSSMSSTMGSACTDVCLNKEVAAVNNFKNYFVGASEWLGSSGNFAEVVRYDDDKCGMALVNVSSGTSVSGVSVPTYMKDGTYLDQVSGNTFTVSGGTISGTMSSTGIAMIYNIESSTGEQKPVSFSLSNASVGANTFYTSSYSSTISIENAASCYVDLGDGNNVKVTDQSVLTINGELNESDTIVFYVTDLNGNKTTYSYTFTMEEQTSQLKYIYFTNNYNWSNVYCYVWKDGGDALSAWPGTSMTYVGTNDMSQTVYKIEIDFSLYDSVIFTNNNGSQTVDISVSYDDAVNAYYISGGSGTSLTVGTWTYTD